MMGSRVRVTQAAPFPEPVPLRFAWVSSVAKAMKQVSEGISEATGYSAVPAPISKVVVAPTVLRNSDGDVPSATVSMRALGCACRSMRL
jgi:hypothetical protein